ncbi:MAG: DUF885 domain-containing protein [Planctomycetota bacterium]
MPHLRLLILPVSFLIAFVLTPCRSGLATDGGASDAEAAFDAIANDVWEFRLQEFPWFATSVGDRRYNDRLSPTSLADSDRRAERMRVFRDQLTAIDRDALPAGRLADYDIQFRQIEERIAEHKYQAHFRPITHRSGFHVDFPELRREMTLVTVDDYEDYIARLASFDGYAAGHIELMRAGIESGKTLSAVTLEGWQESVDTHIVDRPEQSLLYEPLAEFPSTVDAAEHERLRSAGRAAIAEGVVAGYRRFRDFMADEYVPQARGSIGISALEDGRAFYRHRVRRYTTLDTTPEEVHQRGLAEVERIRGEMDDIIREVGFDGDFAAFTEHLRTAPQFYADDEETLLKEVAFVLKTADGKLPELFGRLPRMPYGVRPVPEYIAPRTTSAYYMRPSGDGSRAGFFYMNTYNLKSRPLYTVAALSLHEAVPGHHLQLALQQEMEGLPNFRKFGGFTAFVEGWALYAERLGLEMGFYEDPYSNFGRLTMEIWRACRLVVDTGIHYFGWTREQAIEFLQANSAMSAHNIAAEVDRYIAWPGQALAYKTGELKIRELRAGAEEQLGSRFDVRAFHDVVLGGGAVPLDILEQNVDRWVHTQAGATAASE